MEQDINVSSVTARGVLAGADDGVEGKRSEADAILP